MKRAWTIASLVAVAACGGGATRTQRVPTSAANALQAIVASFDVTVGPPSRFLVGLETGDRRLVGFGTVRVRVQAERVSAPAGTFRDATFLPIPGTQVPQPLPLRPALVDALHGRGVYAATVAFDEPGLWKADVDADVEGLGHVTATTEFQVSRTHSVIAVGNRAPASENYTITNHDGDPLSAVDSRAQGSAPIPDPELHRSTIAAALAAHRPIVAVFSTPVYCQSRFCGPITDMVANVAQKYARNVTFVHVEIYENFDKQQINAAVPQWLELTPGDINEPWVFVIDRNGIVKARFDNVTTRNELARAIRDVTSAAAAR